MLFRSWHPEGRVTLTEALASYTRNGASLLGDGDRRGVLRAGNVADLTLLTGTLGATAPADIHTLHVAATVLAGRVVHER